MLTLFLKTSRRFYRPKKTAVNICELIKNHIKNYIKIMGLAAVPFGTAQAWNDKIEIKCKEKNDATHFRISFRRDGEDLCTEEFTWSYGEELPELLPSWGCRYGERCEYCFPKKTTVFLDGDKNFMCQSLVNVLTFKDEQDAEKFCVAHRSKKKKQVYGFDSDCIRDGVNVRYGIYFTSAFVQMKWFKELYHKGKFSEDKLRSMADCVAKKIECTSKRVIEFIKDKKASIDVLAGDWMATKKLEKKGFYKDCERWEFVLEDFHTKFPDSRGVRFFFSSSKWGHFWFRIKREGVFPKPKYLLETEYSKIFPIILSDIPVRGLMGYFNHLLFDEDCFFYSKKDDILILEGIAIGKPQTKWTASRSILEVFSCMWKGFGLDVKKVSILTKMGWLKNI